MRSQRFKILKISLLFKSQKLAFQKQQKDKWSYWSNYMTDFNKLI